MSKKLKRRRLAIAPTCPYCEQPSQLCTDLDLYGQDYGGRRFWRCVPCGAYVGTHRNSDNVPLGRLANGELRAAKIAAHHHFDALWQAAVQLRGWSKSHARTMAYAWLARELGITARKCHIGYFDLEMTQRTIRLCSRTGNHPKA